MNFSSQENDVYRYSVRTVAGFGFAISLGLIPASILFVVAARQYMAGHNIADIFVASMFAILALYLTVSSIVWLRNRPRLELTADGIFVSKLGSRRTFMPWSDIESVEDFRRFAARTGRPLRFFEIRAQSGVAKFNQFYSQLPKLIARLNEEIQRRGIPVIVHNFEYGAIISATIKCHTPAEQEQVRKHGAIIRTDRLAN